MFKTHENEDRRLSDSGLAAKQIRTQLLLIMQDCLEVLYDITTCRPYLFGETFDVFTDGNCLRWLMVIADPSGCLICWRLCLSKYNLVIHYKKVVLKNQADTLRSCLLMATLPSTSAQSYFACTPTLNPSLM